MRGRGVGVLFIGDCTADFGVGAGKIARWTIWIPVLNALPRFDFSGGPPVKTGGFPAYGGRRGLRPLGKNSRPMGETRSRAIATRRATNGSDDWATAR